MAKKKKSLRKKKSPRFDPLASGYKTQSDFERGVKRRAQSRYAPQAGDLRSLEGQEAGRHAGRQRDISGAYGAWQGGLDKAYADYEASMNKLIAANSASDAATRSTMEGILRTTGSEAGALGQTIGGSVPTNLGAITTSGMAPTAASDTAFRGIAAGNLREAHDRRGMAGAGRAQSTNTELMRTKGVSDDLARQKMELRRRIPEFESEARAELLGEERQSQNLRFQQGLAKDEFGLKKKEQKTQEENLKFQQWLATQNFELEASKFTHQQSLDQATLDLERDKLIASSNPGEEEQIAKRWDNGTKVLNGYLAKTKDEKKNRKKHPYKRSFNEALRLLTIQVRLSKKDALKLMLSSPFATWRKRAKALLAPKKKSNAGDRGVTLGSGDRGVGGYGGF